MDGADLTTPTPMSTSMHQQNVSRPTLGFPLGTALLLIVVFCLSGIFSCCYHWDKLRSLRRRRHVNLLPATTTTTSSSTAATAAAHITDPHHPHSIPPPTSKLITSKYDQDAENKTYESLPVIMPGDQIPKFVAWPCPCHSQTIFIQC